MSARDRELGMPRTINRRDFVGGLGVALSGSHDGSPTAEHSGSKDSR